MVSSAVDGTGKEVRLLNKHPLRQRHRPGPDPSGTEPDSHKILDKASRILDLVDKGEMSVYPPQTELSLAQQPRVRLTAQEEKELAYRVHTWGDVAARNKLIMSVDGMAHAEAHKAANDKFKFKDLLQEARLGVMRATETFEPEMNIRFITYASEWIRARIKRFKQRDNKHNAFPIEGAPLETLPNGKRTRPKQKIISTNAPVAGDDGDKEVGDEIVGQFTSAEDELIKKEISVAVRDAIQKSIEDLKETLDERNIHRLAKLVEMRLLTDEPATLSQVGEETGVSREAIRILESRLMKRMAVHLKGKML